MARSGIPGGDLTSPRAGRRPRNRNNRAMVLEDPWDKYGLDKTKRLVVLTMAEDAADAPTVHGYASTFAAAVTTRDANQPAIILLNEQHSDVPTEQGSADLSAEWYDREHANVWWR